MENKQETASILIEQDGTAAYERVCELPSKNGEPPRRRVMETKRVDANVLIPDAGGLVLQPPNTRFYRGEEGCEVFVIEDQPSVRTVRWLTENNVESPVWYREMKERLRRSGFRHQLEETPEQFEKRLRTQTVFRLAFPVLVRFFVFSNGHFKYATLWYRRALLTSERDGLCVPNLPNWCEEQGGTLCITEYTRNLDSRGRSAAQQVRLVEEDFWGGKWNDHWMESFQAYAELFPDVASPWEWEWRSRIDPLFMLQLPWRGVEDRTVGSEVRRLINASRQERIFSFLERRIRAADAWEGKPKAAEEDVERVSPSETLYLNDGNIVSIGDILTFKHPLVQEMQSGTAYVIEWFTRTDALDKSRKIKLKGVAEPVKAIRGNALAGGVTIVRQEHKEADIVLDDGTPVMPGGFCRFSQDEWPRRASYYHEIIQVKRGRRNTICVRIKDDNYDSVIGEGGKLYPGVRLFPRDATDANGKLLAKEIVLADGRRAHIRDEIFVACGHCGCHVHTITALFGRRHGGEFDVSMELSNGTILASDADIGPHGKYDLVSAESSEPQDVMIGNARYRVGTVILRGDAAARIERIVPYVFGRAYAMYMFNGERVWQSLGPPGKDGNPKVPIAPRLIVDEEENWFRLGNETWTRDTTYMCPGKGLVRVARFMDLGSGSVKAELEEGETCFVVKGYRLNNTLQPVVTRLRIARDLQLKHGQRIRLRAETLKYHVGNRFLISHFLPREAGDTVRIVTTGGVLFELPERDLCMLEVRIHGKWKPLGEPSTLTRGIMDRVASRIFDRVNMGRYRARKAVGCVKPPGMPTGARDAQGYPIVYGSRVRVVNMDGITPEQDVLPTREILNGRPALVVHAYDNGRSWLLLDIGERAGSGTKGLPTSRWAGMSSVPDHLKNDVSWLQRIVYVRADCCLIVSKA